MIGVFLLGVLLVVFLWRQVYGKNWLRNLYGTLEFEEEYVYAGEQAHMWERIENRKRLPVPVLELSFQIYKGVLFHNMENAAVSDYLYKRDIFSLLGFQRVNRKLTIDCIKRGCYSVKEIELRTFSLLFRKRYMYDQPIEAGFSVYARRVDVSDVILMCERMMGSLQCAKRLYEDPFAFHAVREYTPIDPMRTINWKASAKTGGLMVNTYDSTLTQKIMIYLDVEDKGIMKKEHLIEESISVAACLAQILIGQGMEVGLAINARPQVRLEPKPHKGQLKKIEQTLCALRAEDETCDYGEILADIPQDAMAVFITRDSARNQPKIEQFLGREEWGLWVCPQDKNERTEVETAGQLTCIVREVTEY